ncbi:hypothetical protein GCM10007382_25270 [Salinibacterium xinjiangense]|nr:hypothetical protein GCM10007382_25270 [Salinibacterium xinjiangense]
MGNGGRAKQLRATGATAGGGRRATAAGAGRLEQRSRSRCEQQHSGHGKEGDRRDDDGGFRGI